MDKKGLKSTTVGLMAGVALFLDTLKALLDFILMGWIVLPFYYMTFWLWFKMHGLNYFSLRRAPTHVLGFAIELIPGISVLPAMTFAVVRVALDAKFKESVSDNIIGRTIEKYTARKIRPERTDTEEIDRAA